MHKLFGTLLAALCLLATGMAPTEAMAQGPVLNGEADKPGAISPQPDTAIPKPIGPLNMSTGTVFKPGKAVASFKAILMDKEDLYDGGDKKSGKYNGKFERTQGTYQASVRYGVADGFDMRVMVPYRDSFVRRRSGAGGRREKSYTETNMGLGDVVAMGRYALWSQRAGNPLSVAVGAGVKMPTGDCDKKNRAPFSNTREYMGPGFQLGTGSWDPKLELGATRMMGRNRLDFHTMYTWGREGEHGLRKGDQFKADLGWAYALNDLFDVEMELNLLNQNRNENGGKYVSNSGGRTVYLTPGVHLKLTDSFSASAGLPYVIHRDLNSDDSKQQYAVGEDYRMVLKLAWKLN